MSAPTYVVSTVLALTANKVTSLILLNPTTVPLRITELSVAFDGASAGAGVGVHLYRTGTSPGSPAGTAATPARENAPTAVSGAQSTALTNLTTEPSATGLELVRSWYVSPYGGLLLEQFPHGREPAVAPNGARMGLRIITPSSVSANVAAFLAFEE